MSGDSTAKSVEIEFDKDKEFTVRLTGAQIKLLLQVVGSMHFKGTDAFLVAETLTVLQQSFLSDAHGATLDEANSKSKDN
jgi:hypothetical protein